MSKRKYLDWICPECGEPLQLMAEWPVFQSRPMEPHDYQFEKIELIRHCKNCLCDWSNIYTKDYSEETESVLERKFWG